MKVYHPDIAGLFYEVDKGQVDDWTDQGWLKSEPKKFAGESAQPPA